MPLSAGTLVGPYEIVAPLGVGGMGEVYRAGDPRLGRDVAIKALPAEFSRDPERLARFEREARLLASLSHPNIAGIHGLEDVAGRCRSTRRSTSRGRSRRASRRRTRTVWCTAISSPQS